MQIIRVHALIPGGRSAIAYGNPALRAAASPAPARIVVCKTNLLPRIRFATATRLPSEKHTTTAAGMRSSRNASATDNPVANLPQAKAHSHGIANHMHRRIWPACRRPFSLCHSLSIRAIFCMPRIAPVAQSRIGTISNPSSVTRTRARQAVPWLPNMDEFPLSMI